MRGPSQSRMNTLNTRLGGHTNHVNQGNNQKPNPRALSPVPDKVYLIRLAKKAPKITVAPLKRINDHMKVVESLKVEQLKD